VLNPNLSNALFYHTKLTGEMDWELPDKVGAPLKNSGFQLKTTVHRSDLSGALIQHPVATAL